MGPAAELVGKGGERRRAVLSVFIPWAWAAHFRWPT
jgi:hypothetical protein